MTVDALRPRLSFACEQDAQRFEALFADPSVIEDLQALGTGMATRWLLRRRRRRS